MLKNYLVIALRNIWKNKLNSFINIIGLTLGLTSSLLILFFIRSELSYENTFPKSDRIYRITNESLEENGKHWAVVSPVHGLEVAESVPEIESVVRIVYCYKQFLSTEDQTGNVIKFQENRGYFAEAGIFDLFDLEFISGNTSNALAEVNSIVLTESLAKKYFGDQDPIGKYLNNDTDGNEYQVTAVIKDLPYNTHLRFDHLISLETFLNRMRTNAPDWLESKGWAYFYTYILMKDGISITNAQSNLDLFAENFYAEWFEGSEESAKDYLKLHFQPIKDVHLHSNLEQEMGANSNFVYVRVFGIVAILILILAGVNFINLSTARAFNRMREVGVRKISGATRSDLVNQFLTESLLIAILAGLLAICLIEVLLPFYNEITGIAISGISFIKGTNLLIILAVVLVFGFLSGLYPSIFMSMFNVGTALKDNRSKNSLTTFIRHCLIIFQFVISTIMIFSTLIIFEQLKFFSHKDLGFNKDKLIAVELYGDVRRESLANTKVLKDYLKSHTAISDVTMCSNVPGERLSVENIIVESMPEDQEMPPIRYVRADHDYIETMGLEIIEGRSFKDWTSETTAFIINEQCRNAINMDELIGKTATNFRDTQAQIIGIVKDFHFASLHTKIEPLVIELNPRWSSNLMVRIAGDNISDAIKVIRDKFQEISPGSVFNHSFVDERLEELYNSEERMKTIFQLFALLAIIISGLGLFGLSVYYSELKIKEIGIRKALGASNLDIVTLLTGKFFIWIGLANLIALPIAWIAMNNWLNDFAFKIDIKPHTFLISIIFSIIITMISVSFHSIKAATENPIKALKYE